MSADTKLSWSIVVERASGSVADWYVLAGRAGVAVKHHPTIEVRTFESQGGQAGVFRCPGLVEFDLTRCVWAVGARANCTAIDLATLIAAAVQFTEMLGSEQNTVSAVTHGEPWQSWTSKKTGRRYIAARLCYQPNDDDLVETVEESSRVPDTIAELVDGGVVR